jgi:hypothetical protein
MTKIDWTTKPDYDLAYKNTRGKEGLYYPGSKADEETICGINRKWHGDALVWKYVDEFRGDPDFPNVLLSVLEFRKAVAQFYRPMWSQFRLDEIHSHMVAEEIFDTAINCGPFYTTIFIQRSCNALNYDNGSHQPLYSPDLVDDGVFGPVTSDALVIISRQHPRLLFNQLNLFQGARYGDIGHQHPHKREMVPGWLNKRVEVFKRT